MHFYPGFGVRTSTKIFVSITYVIIHTCKKKRTVRNETQPFWKIQQAVWKCNTKDEELKNSSSEQVLIENTSRSVHV